MPTYVYKCPVCETREERRFIDIDKRDEQRCDKCSQNLNRIPAFTGSVWAPTAGGMR